MKIIVAGLPKTGTKSMTAALRILGYNVYDFIEHLYLLEKDWDDVFQKGFTTEKFHKMYKDVDAAVDMPASHFWEEIQKAFPDAKVILTVRDSEDIWFESLQNHYRVLDGHILARIVQFVELVLQRRAGITLTLSYKLMFNIDRALWGRKTHLNESLLKMKYRTHNKYVKQTAASNQLLIFNCKQGWQPLCDFLEVPVPDMAFPFENIRASIIDESANKHSLGQKYKKELIDGVIKLILKITFVWMAIFVFARILG